MFILANGSTSNYYTRQPFRHKVGHRHREKFAAFFFQKVDDDFTPSVRTKANAENDTYSSNELFFGLSGKLY